MQGLRTDFNTPYGTALAEAVRLESALQAILSAGATAMVAVLHGCSGTMRNAMRMCDRSAAKRGRGGLAEAGWADSKAQTSCLSRLTDSVRSHTFRQTPSSPSALLYFVS